MDHLVLQPTAMWSITYHMAGLDCRFDLLGVEVKLRIGSVSSSMVDNPFVAKPNNQIRTSNECVQSSVAAKISNKVLCRLLPR